MPGQFEQFYAHVLADISLQEKLRESGDVERFAALLVKVGRECGFAFNIDDVSAGMHARLPLVKGLVDSTIRETPLPPKGWLPIRASWHDGELYLHWSYFGDQRLREPFFEGDVQRANFKPFNRLFRYTTPIAKLGNWLQEHPDPRPNGFIFHMSRCGSTLVSQMLAAVAHNVVISEADPIDAVVRAREVRPDLSEDQHALWLSWMIGALGQRRGGDESNYFIKLDSWHSLALPLFRRAFPDVPWIFIYRNPVEVLVSQMRMPGLHMIPGMLGSGQFGINLFDSLKNREDYCARVLAAICAPVLRQYSKDKALLVDYRQLPHAVWTAILPHFGVEYSDSDRTAMAEAARYDAKTPSFEFAPDTETKQRDATAGVRAAAGARLVDLYRQLEVLRLGG
ncbi:MAG TPA: sulfotransferase [Pseudolabrys sp.]